MTAEKILNKIKKDAEKEIQQIQKEAEKQCASIINHAKNEARVESEKIVSSGKQQAVNIQQILISQANQDMKREMMNAREHVIEECFTKAHHELSILKEEDYKKTVTKLIEDGRQKLGGKCSLIVSRDIDRKIAENMGLPVIGTTEVAGGVIIKSGDGKITLDNTFDGILKRKKEEIRRKVGTLLFAE